MSRLSGVRSLGLCRKHTRRLVPGVLVCTGSAEFKTPLMSATFRRSNEASSRTTRSATRSWAGEKALSPTDCPAVRRSERGGSSSEFSKATAPCKMMKKQSASTNKKMKDDESGEEEQSESNGQILKKKPAGKQVYNIDDTSEEEVVDKPMKSDKNIVSWFKQYEHTLPKVFLLLVGSLATIAFDSHPTTWKH